MPRQHRSEEVVAKIAKRLIKATEIHLGIRASELSRLLGYANPSTLQAVKRGASLPDFARLAEHQDKLKDAQGRRLNFHWVVTGDGPPLLGQLSQVDNDIIINLSKLSVAKKEALLKLLSD